LKWEEDSLGEQLCFPCLLFQEMHRLHYFQSGIFSSLIKKHRGGVARVGVTLLEKPLPPGCRYYNKLREHIFLKDLSVLIF